MQEEPKKYSRMLDILCIGETGAGKSYFLKQYTNDEQRDNLPGPYDIYVKMIDEILIYFHELSEQQSLYLEKSYDGILFFVDFIDTRNVVKKILNWVELQSKYTGYNIFKIPIQIVVTKIINEGKYAKQKKYLESQLQSIVNLNQITYFQCVQYAEKPLLQFFTSIIEGKAEGIKQTHQNHFRLYGFGLFFKQFVINAKLTFFRCAQIFDKRIRNRISLNVTFKSN